MDISVDEEEANQLTLPPTRKQGLNEKPLILFNKSLPRALLVGETRMNEQGGLVAVFT